MSGGFRLWAVVLLFGCIVPGQEMLNPPPGSIEIEGAFLMGCDPSEEPECWKESSPRHEVTLSPFSIDDRLVTVGDYSRCVRDRGCEDRNVSGGNAESPTGATWYQARDYCEWRGKRLPTEAEWERAARGEDGQLYPWGDEPHDCWFDATIECPAGPEGIEGMHKAQWVMDWFSDKTYSHEPRVDPVGPPQGTHKVVRGVLGYEGRLWMRGGAFPGVLAAYFRCVTSDADAAELDEWDAEICHTGEGQPQSLWCSGDWRPREVAVVGSESFWFGNDGNFVDVSRSQLNGENAQVLWTSPDDQKGPQNLRISGPLVHFGHTSSPSVVIFDTITETTVEFGAGGEYVEHHLSGDELFWVEGGQASFVVYRAPASGGAASVLVSSSAIAEAEGQANVHTVTSLASDPDFVYLMGVWTHHSSIVRVAKADGSVDLVARYVQADQLHVDGEMLYFGEGTIFRVPKSGGEPEEVAGTFGGRLLAMRDDSALYFHSTGGAGRYLRLSLPDLRVESVLWEWPRRISSLPWRPLVVGPTARSDGKTYGWFSIEEDPVARYWRFVVAED